MGNLTIKEFVNYFWINIDQISKTDNVGTEQLYEKLLLSILDISKEILSELDSDEMPGSAIAKTELPLLAMISEIQLLAPNAVANVALVSESIKKSLSILENYSSEKRLVLRKHFLNREQADVYRFDDYRK